MKQRQQSALTGNGGHTIFENDFLEVEVFNEQSLEDNPTIHQQKLQVRTDVFDIRFG